MSESRSTHIEPMPVKQTQPPRNRHVQVQLQYLKDDPIYASQKPVQITPNFMDKEGRTNVRLAPGQLETIHDVRGREADFTLDANGFQYIKAPTSFKDWSSQPAIAQRYLPELESVLRREVDGCDEIIFYDARIRHADDAGLRVEGLSYNPFAKQVHTDNTERSVLMKIKNLTDMKADYLLSGRARIINIWRPIKHPVYDCGLTIADGAKIREDDILECDRHRQDTGEWWDTMGVIKYRKGFDWYYCSEQAEEDVLLFKNYDSATHVHARTCLHSAFDLPADMVPSGAPTRESIEVRALIFTYPEHGRRPSHGWSMPHPLAERLEQGQLKRVDDERSITDRLRTDIDEGHEIKDAMLILRRQEIRRLELIGASLKTERDDLKTQLQIQTAHSAALEAQVRDLLAQLSHGQPHLRGQGEKMPAELMDARSGPKLPTSSTGASDEIPLLCEQLAAAQTEARAWKDQALSVGSAAISKSYQAAVDEAVRREREKDAFIVSNLRGELED